MVRVVRSATLQMRVTPAIKHASEQVLRRIGMSMTEAMELFLRRLIVDQRMPFDIVAIDPTTHTQLLLDWEDTTSVVQKHYAGRASKRSRSRA
jgi:addiction module RelB/DinJ family antitoxin